MNNLLVLTIEYQPARKLSFSSHVGGVGRMRCGLVPLSQLKPLGGDGELLERSHAR
jgi:hypothetical protein